MSQLPDNNTITQEMMVRLIGLNVEQDTLTNLEKMLRVEWLKDTPNLSVVNYLVHEVLVFMYDHQVEEPELVRYYYQLRRFALTVRAQTYGKSLKDDKKDDKKYNDK